MEELFSVLVGGLAAVLTYLATARASAAVSGRRERLRTRRMLLALADLSRERLHGTYFRAAVCRERVPPSLDSTVAGQSAAAREMLDAAVGHIESARRLALRDLPRRAGKCLSRAKAMARRAQEALDQRDLWLATEVENTRTLAYEQYGRLRRHSGEIAVYMLRRSREGVPVHGTATALRRLAIAVCGVKELVRRDPKAALDALESQALQLRELVREARIRIDLWRQLSAFEAKLPERIACLRAMRLTASRAIGALAPHVGRSELDARVSALASTETLIGRTQRLLLDAQKALALPQPPEYQDLIRRIVLADSIIETVEESALQVIELHELYSHKGMLPGGKQAVTVH